MLLCTANLLSDGCVGNEARGDHLSECGKLLGNHHTIGTPTVETKLMSKKSTQISVPKQTYM